jgi:hypothetical protein
MANARVSPLGKTCARPAAQRQAEVVDSAFPPSCTRGHRDVVTIVGYAATIAAGLTMRSCLRRSALKLNPSITPGACPIAGID